MSEDAEVARVFYEAIFGDETWQEATEIEKRKVLVAVKRVAALDAARKVGAEDNVGLAYKLRCAHKQAMDAPQACVEPGASLWDEFFSLCEQNIDVICAALLSTSAAARQPSPSVGEEEKEIADVIMTTFRCRAHCVELEDNKTCGCLERSLDAAFAVLALLSTSGREGWQLVPVEPTIAMMDAVGSWPPVSMWDLKKSYQDMLAAAPTAEDKK